MVIQVIRLSTIEAFISYQMSTIERVSTMEFRKIFKHKQLNYAKDYIINNKSIYIDQNRKYIGELIEYYPFDIAYIKFYYEDLIGIHQDKYWNAMFSFIGVNYKKSNKYNSKNMLIKKHSIPCYKKISNWDEVKSYLINTSSYWMCQKH